MGAKMDVGLVLVE